MKTLLMVCVVVMLFANTANADPTIETLTGWTKIYSMSDHEKIRLVLKNPNEGEYLYALVEIGEIDIRYFILVGIDLKMYVNVYGTFEEIEMSEEAKKNVWTFLRDKLGIRTI